MKIPIFSLLVLVFTNYQMALAQGSISGPSSLCGSSTSYQATYTISGSSATSGYSWSVNGGGMIASGQGTKTVTVQFYGAGFGRTVQVSGNGLSANLSVKVYGVFSMGSIQGQTSVCPGGAETYATYLSGPSVADQIHWVTNNGITKISESNTSLTVKFPENYTGGQNQILCYAVFGPCGAGPVTALDITSTSGTVPADAEIVSGFSTVDPGQTGVVYSVPIITNATSYQWKLPPGTSLVSTNNTSTITVNFNTNFGGGNLSVAGVNGTCLGAPSNKYVTSAACATLATGPISGDGSVCPGETGVVYTISSVSGATNYVWTLPNGQQQMTTTPTITINYSSGAKSGILSVYAQGANCNGGPASSINISVIALPNLTITNPGPACAGQGVSVSFQAQNTSGSNYQWYKNNVLMSDGSPTEPGFVYTPQTPLSAGDQIKCTASFSDACVSNVLKTSNIVSITTQPPSTPTINITTSPGMPVTICPGGNITFTANPGNSAYTLSNFQWKLNGVTVNGNNTNTYIPTEFTDGSVVDVSASVSGCVTTTSASISTQGYPISVLSPYSVNINLSGNVILHSTESQEIIVSPSSGDYTYSWKKNGAIIPGANTSLYTASQSGIYTATVTKWGCSKASGSVNITVNSRPTADAGDDKTIIRLSNVALVGSGIDVDGTIIGYTWSQVSGPDASDKMSSPSPNKLDLTGLPVGTYVFSLIVTDNTGENSLPDLVTIIAEYPHNNYNWLKETVVMESGKVNKTEVAELQVQFGEKNVNWTYFDGLGRSSQHVSQQASPDKKDIVQPRIYDEYGKESVSYSPFTKGTNGYYKSDAVGEYSTYRSSPQALFYGSQAIVNNVAYDSMPYSVAEIEHSPLSRVIKQGAPGEAWQPENGKVIKFDYESNKVEKVIVWKVSNYSPQFPFGFPERVTLQNGDQNQFHKTIIKDEHDNKTLEYTDKEGRIVLRRIQFEDDTSVINDSVYASTYYLYDDLGDLVYVLPPTAVEKLSENFFGSTDLEKESFLAELTFRYKFDHRRRMVMKQVPGAEPVYMVYDKRDRLVLVQDGNHRKDDNGVVSKRDWQFTKYDVFNRAVATGIYTHSTVLDREGMQNYVDNTFYIQNLPSSKAWFETYIGAGGVHGYDNKSFPQVSDSTKYFTISYYDNYNFKSLISDVDKDYTVGDLPDQEIVENPNVIGNVTGRMVKVLGSSTFLWTVNYYDRKYRPIQFKSKNHLNGVDRVTKTFDFVGRETAGLVVHKEGANVNKDAYRFAYDHAGRVLRVFHQFNDEDEVLLSAEEYNELGQLKTKKLHSRDNGNLFGQEIDYNYTIRGWLEQINDVDSPDEKNLFSLELNYDKPTSNGGVPQYNGNICEMRWNTVGSGKKSYGYHYDNLNRLTYAHFYETDHDMQNGRYDVAIGDEDNDVDGYDLNGNILALTRNGKNGSSSIFGLMDNITYSYSGNQLTSVNDDIDMSVDEEGFKEIVKVDNEYVYDWNGNMTKDANKGITSISYNHLNLPVEVHKGPVEYIKYTYDATGKKLRQQVYGSTAKITDYVGAYVYENGIIQFVNHSEGRIIPSNDSELPVYQYYLKDHLGNVRITFNEETSSISYLATMERNPTSVEISENSTFLNMNNQKKVNASMYNHTSGSGKAYSYRLSGVSGEVIGPAKSLEVKAGDMIDMEVYATYTSISSGNTGMGTFASAIIGAFGLSPNGTGAIDGEEAYHSFSALFSGGPWIGSSDYEDEDAPKAFMNYLLFDENYNLVDVGFDQVSTLGDGAHDLLSLHIRVNQDGFLYIYLSNEDPDVQDVYFDDFAIRSHSAIVQSMDYYPFG